MYHQDLWWLNKIFIWEVRDSGEGSNIMTLWGLLVVAAAVTFWGLAYLEAPLWIWTLTVVLTIGTCQWLHVLPTALQICLWVVLVGFIVVFNLSFVRQKMLTVFIFRWFKKVLPPMSTTEREAIEAGDTWWEGELFQGCPEWQKLLNYSKPTLSEAELSFLNHQVEVLCDMLDDWSITHTTLDLPVAAWDYLKKEGFFGMIIPKEYGGLGFSALGNSTIVQKIATRSLTAAITTMVPNSLGPGELLTVYGTDAQKDYYLPRLAKGIDIPCFALTGPEAGSDAGAIPDTGIICRGEFEGKSIIGMKLTWNKRYITLAPVATVLGLAFKLYDPEKILGGSEKLGITLCLLPTNHPGVEIGKRHFPLNQPFMNGPTRGKDVFVPLDWIIGGPNMAGKGWRMLVECLSAGRGISLPALSTAAAKMGYRTTGAYARVRKQFNTSLGHFEGVEAAMARIAGFTYLIEATRLLTLSALDQHHRPSVVTAIAKYHMTEMSRQVLNDAMDIHGGKAIMLGPKNYLGRAYESLPISITVEGANILTRNLIIFGQGAIRCHPYLQAELMAASNSDEVLGLKNFDNALMKHLSYSLAKVVRNVSHAFTAGLFCTAPKGMPFKRYYQQLGRMSAALAFVADTTLIVLGGKLKRRESLSARLGDVLSYLYLGSAVLKYYHDANDKKCDIPYVTWALETCLTRAQEAFLAFFKNFPIPVLGFLLRFSVFPYGRVYALPNDNLEHQLAASMMTPSLFRDRLTQYCYLSHQKTDPIAQLETVLHAMMTEEIILSKIDTAVKEGLISKTENLDIKLQNALAHGIITEEEIKQVHEFERAKFDVIQVDEFSVEQLIGK